MGKIENHHPAPCQTCGHRDLHSTITGCTRVVNDTRHLWCTCTAYAVPPPTTGRVIPSRNTDPGTSHEAATRVVIRANSQRARLLVAWAHLDDATDEEAMHAAEGVSPVSEYAKRSSELRQEGLIEMTGGVRNGSAGTPRIVSRITDAGRKVVASL